MTKKANSRHVLFCIFSYNRGHYLKNLVNSIYLFFSLPKIVVFDDGSDNEETKVIIQSLKKLEIEVFIFSGNIDSKHGGLYANMNFALAYAAAEGYEYTYF